MLRILVTEMKINSDLLSGWKIQKKDKKLKKIKEAKYGIQNDTGSDFSNNINIYRF